MSARTELIVADQVVASVAAHAAAAVPGVVRVEHGLRGLVTALTRAGRQLWTGYEIASTKGVRMQRDSGSLAVELEIAIAAERHAGTIGTAVQHAVVRTVREQTGVRVDEVSVTIVDIEPEAR
ncbi:Asp23/Gls24 family envelope stress response protein [Nocardia sp. NBC_01503]|uniref:Asp23/Gls24 family envelope stress response protein n=1 Tax=Nocardia sp. NBC_01503 TaxID=2975997 RepID=UPI002E7ABFA1|nr:Asp23/Gls24 family envelope stress response protein [Nocardia sp. NBC_01503]WTL30264.1 Asp23/Gls24 family envelope stress response protein [Nocardia sp. NBC_01503]